MWDFELFGRAIDKATKDEALKKIMGDKKYKIRDYLNEQYHLGSSETIKSWERRNSNGPRDPKTKKDLEKIFGVTFDREVNSNKEEGYTMNDFVRQKIFECYNLMKDYVRSEEVESEDAYCEMRYQLEKKKIAIPQEIFAKIASFADVELGKIIYDYENTFAATKTDELGYIDEDGCFNYSDEEATFKGIILSLDIILKIERKLDNFGEEELSPILTA